MKVTCYLHATSSFTPAEKAPGMHRTGGWTWRLKSLLPLLGIELPLRIVVPFRVPAVTAVCSTLCSVACRERKEAVHQGIRNSCMMQ
jgi:hypothetical protein